MRERPIAGRETLPRPQAFEKYERMGAYHWRECDPRDSEFNPPVAARYQVVAKRITAARRALDVGCGDGYLMHLVGSRCRVVIGIEHDRAGALLCRDKLRMQANCGVVRASCYQIPFGDRSFDLVTLTDVIEHLEDPAACLREIGRLLDRDGTLLLTTPKWRSDRRWDTAHVQEYRADELLALMEPHFEDVSLVFFWPLRWCRVFDTRVGFKVVPVLARCFSNPFLREARTDSPDLYGQMLAVCRKPRHTAGAGAS